MRKKAFVFLSGDEFYEGKLSMTVKLPISGEIVKTTLPYVEAAGHGLGKSGWVTARFDPKGEIDIGLLKDWIDQSYVAIAPKKLGALVARESAAVDSPKKNRVRTIRTKTPRPA